MNGVNTCRSIVAWVLIDTSLSIDFTMVLQSRYVAECVCLFPLILQWSSCLGMSLNVCV